MFERPATSAAAPRILVVGVGGGGCKAVNRMVQHGLQGVAFAAIDSDAAPLAQTLAPRSLLLGAQGRGAQADPQVGSELARDHQDAIAELVRGQELVLVVAGLGAGTGGGAAPIVCEVARKAGAVVLGAVTLPFHFEGPRRGKQALNSLGDMKAEAIMTVALPGSGIWEGFAKRGAEIRGKEGIPVFAEGDRVLFGAVRSLRDLASGTDGVASVAGAHGLAVTGVGVARGQHRVREAVGQARQSPMLAGMNLRHAHRIWVTFHGAAHLDRSEATKIAREIGEANGAHPDLVVGWSIDDSMGNAVEVTVLATGADAAIHTAVQSKGLSGM